MPSQKLQDALELFLTYYKVNQLPCGIILVGAKEIGDVRLQEMKAYFGKGGSQLVSQYYYDYESGILAILLADRNLSFAHFQSLLVKDYLQQRDLLAGQILIASFPENGNSALQLFKEMQDEMSKDAGNLGEIRIFNAEALASKEKIRILVVNDDVTINEFLNIYLCQKGYIVHFAYNGREGIAKFKELKPDLVIVELNLPIVDGYHLIRTIKDSEQGKSSKMMVLTNKRLEDDIKRTFDMGVSDYMTKPFSPVELEARIKRLFQKNEYKGEF
ncbi:response regulator transcription factor [Paenibacillus filicis]|uniref:Response regulator transcription factor n=1 Tax=Paenibacillus filicis TaxID=669464 RepID=A0ABU9DPM7_9BACL